MTIEPSSVPHSRPTLDGQSEAAIAAALRSLFIARGERVLEFERRVADYMGCLYAVAVPTGTRALRAVLAALDVGRGDEVVIPTYVCAAVETAVLCTGAVPVLCDVELDWCMSRATVRSRLTPRTRAVVVVHPFGAAADAEGIASLGVPIVEDCCQAFGATRDGRRVGSIGVAAVLSFHATKLLTTGEGGMAVSSDRALFERIGAIVASEREAMSDVQAALGLSQLDAYGSFLSRRRELADRYFDVLMDLPIDLPRALRDRSVFFRFPVKARGDFAATRARFDRAGVQVRRGVDALMHRAAGHDRSLFPNAERLFAETVSLPIYPSLTEDECVRVIDAARRVFSETVAAC
jgi:UDP-4-amino-4-deoxy-L-arabinose-oxoglutarate aminotransferase